MTAIEQFIKDGEEAWQNKEPFKHTFVSANGYWAVFLDANGREYTVALSNFLIDPKHWRAVGETRGWGNMWESYLGLDVPLFRYKQHEFCNHLANGLSIEEALKKI